MYCGQCGKEIKDSSVFCPYCGNKAQIENAEQIECIGKILEKRESMIMVEVENGERKYFYVEPSIIVMVGDFGKMTFQSGILIAFQKMKER